VADQLIESGQVRRAWIGVSFQELTPQLARQLDVEADGGAVVGNVVPGGPADEAGVKPGDVIVSVDGEALEEGHDLLRSVIAKQVGQQASLGIVRDGKKKKLRLTLGARPSQQERAQAGGSSGQGQPSADFGLALQPMSPALARRLGDPNLQGVVVADVAAGSPAQRAGLREGDVIVSADRKPVTSPDEVEEALSDGAALLRVRRGEGAFFVPLEKNG
jgi:serine protease Do